MNIPDGPEPTREHLIQRAERLAEEAEELLPSWLRPGNPESRLPVLFALVVAAAMQLAVPGPLHPLPAVAAGRTGVAADGRTSHLEPGSADPVDPAR